MGDGMTSTQEAAQAVTRSPHLAAWHVTRAAQLDSLVSARLSLYAATLFPCRRWVHRETVEMLMIALAALESEAAGPPR